MRQHNTVGTFPKFQELPAELRLQVWGIVGFQRRDVDLLVDLDPEFDDRISYMSRFPAPSILHVNQESREEGLKWYILGFGTSFIKGHHTVSTPARIYFNIEADRLCAMNLNDGMFTDDGWSKGLVSNELGILYERQKFKSLALNLQGFKLDDLNFLKSGLIKQEELSLIVEPWEDDSKLQNCDDWNADDDSYPTLVCGEDLESFPTHERNKMNQYLEEDREKIFERECPYKDIEGFWDPNLKTTHQTATTVHVEEES